MGWDGTEGSTGGGESSLAGSLLDLGYGMAAEDVTDMGGEEEGRGRRRDGGRRTCFYC